MSKQIKGTLMLLLAMLIGAALIGLRHWCRTSMKELEDMIDELETEERKGLNERKDT